MALPAPPVPPRRQRPRALIRLELGDSALPPGAGDAEFLAAWPAVEAHLERHRPQFVLLQCGADSLAGDPITHLALSEEAHAEAARSLCRFADRHADGRILGTGGGGYNRKNIARAWTRVVQAFVEAA